MDDQEELKPWELPGTPRGDEIVQRDAQQSFWENLSDSFNSNTGAGAGIRVVQDEAELLTQELFGDVDTEQEDIDEAVAAGELVGGELRAGVQRHLAGMGTLLGMRAGPADYNKSEKAQELLQGIPYEMQSEIMAHDNLAAARRARQRILDDMERGRRLGMQTGATSGLAIMAGSVVDVDVPLIFMTGGGFAAARVARAGRRFGQGVGMGVDATKRLSSTALGVSAGAQAGLAAGLGEQAWRETADWTMLYQQVLMAAAMGGTINGAIKGDMGVQLKAAEEDLHRMIANDAPELSRTSDLNNMQNYSPNVPGADDLDVIVTPRGETPVGQAAQDGLGSTVGASQVQGYRTVDRTALDPISSPREREITQMTEDWRYSSGWDQRKKDAEEEFLFKYVVGTEESGILGRAFSSTARDYNAILKSDSPTFNYMAGEIFESPHGFGRGRVTAAVQQEQYNKIITEPIVRVNELMQEWAKHNAATFIPGGGPFRGAGVTQRANRRFSREVHLEVSRRNLRGQSMKVTDENSRLISEAADMIEDAGNRAREIMRGRGREIPVDGAEHLVDKPYYMHTWSNRALRDFIKKGVISDGSVIKDLAEGYRKAGLFAGAKNQDRLAEAVATALVTRMRNSAEGFDMSMQNLLTADGRAFLEDMLRTARVKDGDIKAIMSRISGVKEDASKIKNLKSRNEIDLDTKLTTTDGSDLRIVDLMEHDINGQWQRYARSVAGSAALARKGITNRAKREDFINAGVKEQMALGEEGVNPDVLRAMFSNFDGGAVHGYIAGRTNQGLNPVVSFAKRLTSVSLLQGLGFAQLAETSAGMAAVGLGNFAERAIHQRLSSMGRAQQRATLRDLEFLTGRIGEDHKFLAPHLELDTLSSQELGQFGSAIQNLLGKAQYVNGFTSGFNQVRSWQQTTVALGIMDHIIQRGLREVDGKRVGWTPKELRRLELDFGIDEAQADRIIKLVDNGTITIRDNLFGGKAVDRLNIDKWPDQELADTFAAGITRKVNQQVQKSMAGEQDVWMNSEAASLLMQFKAFPMQAITKQTARNLRFMDQETLMAFSMAMVTAYASLYLRDVAYGRERSVGDRAKAAVGYSNFTGFIPMAWDPAMTMMGYSDARFNPFGSHYTMSMPSLDVASKLLRVPGAGWEAGVSVFDGGDISKGGQSALKALPLMNVPFFSRLMWD